jgi:hypothetical protein
MLIEMWSDVICPRIDRTLGPTAITHELLAYAIEQGKHDVVDVDPDPADLARQVVRDRVVLGDQGAVLLADVAGVVGREDHRRGRRDGALADLLAVEEQRQGPALPEPGPS